MRHWRLAFAGLAVIAAAVSGGGVNAAPPPAAVPIAPAAIRAAKVGWSRFVAGGFATPNAIAAPCPLLPVETVVAHVNNLGLVPSVLPYGVFLYRDFTGAGIVGVRCSVDFNRAADPQGSTAYAVEATVLDGQAEFPQYVARLAGTNTPIAASPELGGDDIGRCRFDPTVCVASWHGDGLVVTVRLDGPRTDQSETHARQLLLAAVPQVVANLGTVPAG